MKSLEDAERELQDIITNAKSLYVKLPTITLRIEKDDLCEVKDKVVDSLQKHQQMTKELKDLLKKLKVENIVGQFESCMVYLGLMFVIDVN